VFNAAIGSPAEKIVVGGKGDALGSLARGIVTPGYSLTCSGASASLEERLCRRGCESVSADHRKNSNEATQGMRQDELSTRRGW
jgi:hypothetical protein